MSKIYGRLKAVWRRAVALTRYVFFICPYEPFEGIWSFLFMTFALSVLDPYSDVYTNGHSYDFLRPWLPEDIFGAILLCIGLNSVFALGSGNLTYRKYTSMAVAVAWTLLFLFFTLGNSTGVLGRFFFFFAVVSINTFARIVRDCRDNTKPWTDKL